MNTSLHFQPYLSLAQPSTALNEPQELLDFYPGDERNNQRTTVTGPNTYKSPTQAASGAAVRAQ